MASLLLASGLVQAAPEGGAASELKGPAQIRTVEAGGPLPQGAASRRPDQGQQTAGGRHAAGTAAWPGSTAAAGKAIAQLQRFAASTRSARGRFVQIQLGAGRRASGRSSGQFAFARPGKFRWEIESPDQQLIVTNGSKLYFYDKDLQQVTVREAGEAIQATPAAVLFGVGELKDSFSLTELGSREGVAWVEALPRQADSGFEQIRIGLRDGKPVVMEVIDAFGQINRFEFSGLQQDVRLPAGHFDFVPPEGVDVLE